MYAALVLCMIGMAMAQTPKPCTTPPTWEANIFDSNEQQKFMIRARLSYDSTYHRERLVEEIDDGTGESFYEVLALFDNQIEFIYNFKAKNCSRQPLTRPWRDFGIRPDARSFGEAYIGTSALPGLGLLVTIWGGNFTTPRNETIREFGTWTYQACLPVSRTTISDRFGRSHVSFFDITAGISNPDVFIPRAECLTEQEQSMRTVLFGNPSKKIHQ